MGHSGRQQGKGSSSHEWKRLRNRGIQGLAVLSRASLEGLHRVKCIEFVYEMQNTCSERKGIPSKFGLLDSYSNSSSPSAAQGGDSISKREKERASVMMMRSFVFFLFLYKRQKKSKSKYVRAFRCDHDAKWLYLSIHP